MKPNKKLTKTQHKKRHVELHRALDELVADWIDHHYRVTKDNGFKHKGLSDTSIMELIKWSHGQTIKPTLPNEN